MGEWADVSLGALAAPNRGAVAIGPFGSAMKADSYVPSGVPVIRGTNIATTRAWKGDWVYITDDFADSMPRCVVRPNTLVFPHRGSVGEVGLVPVGNYSRYFLSTSLMKIELDEKKANPLFVYYFFKSSAGREEILKYASQVGTPGIGQPLASLKSFKLPYPPLAIQQVIASILGSLDDKIELNRQMNETLEAMARALFKDWFVDFGPTRAKMEGSPPYLAPEIWSLFPDRLDDEGKPEGWQVRPIPEAIDFKEGPGIRNWQYTNTDEGTRFINIRCIKDGDLDIGTANRVTDAEANGKYDHFKLKEWDIVVSTSGTLGRSAIVRKEHLPLILNTSVIRFRPIKDRSSVAYLYCFLRGHAFLEKLEAMASGSVQKNFGPMHLEQMSVLTPPPQIIDHHTALVMPMLEKIVANRTESTALAATRDLLLPKLMSGEIRVQDAEKALDAVA